jgi:hypothetical protein
MVTLAVFWPFWSSCMHKCIPVLVRKISMLGRDSQTSKQKPISQKTFCSTKQKGYSTGGTQNQLIVDLFSTFNVGRRIDKTYKLVNVFLWRSDWTYKLVNVLLWRIDETYKLVKNYEEATKLTSLKTFFNAATSISCSILTHCGICT